MVFYTKKAKAKMRDRRRKLIKAGDGDGNVDGGSAGDDGHHEHDASTITSDGNNETKQGSRKRNSDQISNGQKRKVGDESHLSSEVHKKAKTSSNQQSTTITVPADLTSKDTKKFRKDARRKARAEGHSDDQIKFVIEGQEPTEEERQKEDDDNNKKKSTKKSFPRINDLLTQHATQAKLAAKLHKQQSQNESLPSTEKQRYVAIDCEMVGIGSTAKKSALARASVVDWTGNVLLDTFVRVPERVTDFRTHVSGIRPKNIHVKNENAMDHEQCRLAVGKLLLNKILVGHALKNDLSVLMLDHPKMDVRDTAKYKPFMRPSGRGGGKLRPRKLRDLVFEELGRRIQVEGEAHCSVDDATASMELFKVVRGRWEKELGEKLKGKKKGGGGSRGKK